MHFILLSNYQNLLDDLPHFFSTLLHSFVQIPLCCVFVRYFILALSAPEIQTYLSLRSRPCLLLLSLCWFATLVLCKIIVGLGLVRYAGNYTFLIFLTSRDCGHHLLFCFHSYFEMIFFDKFFFLITSFLPLQPLYITPSCLCVQIRSESTQMDALVS